MNDEQTIRLAAVEAAVTSGASEWNVVSRASEIADFILNGITSKSGPGVVAGGKPSDYSLATFDISVSNLKSEVDKVRKDLAIWPEWRKREVETASIENAYIPSRY